jgi:RNA polymerase sigma factor (TIGR02999 family)
MPENAAELKEITLLLKRVSAGDESAESPLADAVYEQMRLAARRIFRGSAGDLTIQPTGLVNVVLMELIQLRSIEWKDRDHFFRTASRMLRRRFIDYIRARKAGKRPSSDARGEFEERFFPAEEHFDEILDVHRGLDVMASFDPDLAELVELVYFGGCPIRTLAEIRNVSPKTISRHLDLAERWLKARFACPALTEKAASKIEG